MEEITFDQFSAVDIRIGTVISAEVPEWSHWVMRIKVDFGPAFAEATAGERIKTAFSGIMKFYTPEDLIGKQFPFVVNLKPKSIGPDKEFSEVMMIMATPEPDTEETKPILFNLQEKVPNGTKVR